MKVGLIAIYHAHIVGFWAVHVTRHHIVMDGFNREHVRIKTVVRTLQSVQSVWSPHVSLSLILAHLCESVNDVHVIFSVFLSIFPSLAFQR